MKINRYIWLLKENNKLLQRGHHIGLFLVGWNFIEEKNRYRGEAVPHCCVDLLLIHLMHYHEYYMLKQHIFYKTCTSLKILSTYLSIKGKTLAMKCFEQVCTFNKPSFEREQIH